MSGAQDDAEPAAPVPVETESSPAVDSGSPVHVRTESSPAVDSGSPGRGRTDPSAAVRASTDVARTTPRRRRRAVRRGAGEPNPLVDLRSADDSDLGWQAAGPDSDDDRLRRDVPPHW